MSQKTAMAADDALSASAAEPHNDPRALAALGEFLGRYKAAAGGELDMLGEQYRVELSMPLPEFDSRNARAYAATDLNEPARPLIALVCQPGSVQRYRAISQLTPIKHPAILPLVAAGSVLTSRRDEERFVIFHERPAGKRLSELLAQHTAAINQSFVCDRILAPLNEALEEFSKLGIAHGMLNPDNIYFGDTAVLGPCVAEPCGMAQTFYYEPLERLQALPAGKGEGSVAQDYYAMAVLVLYILYGKEHFAHLTPESLPRLMLRDGVYNAMTHQKEMPEIFYDFFRGMLCAKAEDRWSYNHVKFWLAGKRYNVLPPPPPMEALRPFEFGHELASTRRELAHFYACDWEHMATSIQSNKLAHWCAVSLRDKDLADSVTRISRAITDAGAKNDLQVSEQLMHILLLLDPHGPIRLKHMAFHIDGIDSMCAELYVTKAHQDLQLLAKFIEMNMVSYWPMLQRKGQEDYVIPPLINTMLIRLDRLRACIRNSGLGFGLERMLYELNPDMSCLSPMLGGAHASTLSALLTRLDKLAPTLAKQEDPIDRHIAAFIASKLNIQHEIRLLDLAGMPTLAASRAVLALHLLAMAQHKTANLKLPGLTHWLGLRILPMLDNIHSRTLREQFKTLLMEKAQSGYTQQLAQVIINADYASADQGGFQEAYNLYHRNAAKIESYRQGVSIDQKSARIGFAMAKTLAYASLAFSVFWVLKDITL